MKRGKVILATGVTAAMIALASLQPMTGDHRENRQPARLAQTFATGMDVQAIHIVPASSEAARIPPELLAELKAVGEP